MGSEQNDGTSVPPSEPKLCANGCGFFGTAANMNLCSKCYRDLRVEEEKAASAKAAMEKTFQQKQVVVNDVKAPVDSDPVKTVAQESSSSTATAAVVGGDQGEVKVANRCFSCRKKVGLTGFKCKCGSTFCSTHRYPNEHKCRFDYKNVGRAEIAKANPLVKADKLERI